MKKLLITGASGFIGKNLVGHLSDEYEILTPSHQDLDLLSTTNVEDYLKENKIDFIIHAAVQGTLGLPESYAQKVLKNNIRMFYNLARCNQLYKIMFYLGSGAEYGKSAYIPRMKETYFGQTVPEDDYGLSKYVIAEAAKNVDNIYNLRLFGVFGPYENYNYRFISNVICKMLCNRDIVIHRNVKFDYLYIDDFGKIMKWFLSHKLLHRTYNVCTGKAIEIATIVQMIRTKLDVSVDIRIEQEGMNPEYSGDNSRLLQELGQFPFITMSEALDRLIDYYKSIEIKLEGDY